jgi:hypothetical protein
MTLTYPVKSVLQYYKNSTVYVIFFIPLFFSINAFNLLNVSSFNAISSWNAESLKMNFIGKGSIFANLSINSSVIFVSRQTK